MTRRQRYCQFFWQILPRRVFELCLVVFCAFVFVSRSLAQVNQDQPPPTLTSDRQDSESEYAEAYRAFKFGKFEAAAASLEKVLKIDPQRYDARLLYVVVLYRLDRLAGAERELDTLSTMLLPANLKQQVEDYQRQIAKLKKKTHWIGHVGVGVEQDTNRNFGASSGLALNRDVPQSLPSSAQRQGDTSLLFLGDTQVSRVLTDKGHSVFGSLSYYRAEQSALKAYDIQDYSARLGGTIKLPKVDLTPSGIFDHVLLQQATYLRNRGAGLRADVKIQPQMNLYLEARAIYQDYRGVSFAPSNQRSGAELDVAAGMDYLISLMTVGGGYLHATKHAYSSSFGFVRDGFEARQTSPLSMRSFLALTETVYWDRYYSADTSVSQRYRRDNTWQATATFGASLGVLSPGLSDFIFSLTYAYDQTVSTIPNYAYTNNKIETMLTYRWDVAN